MDSQNHSYEVCQVSNVKKHSKLAEEYYHEVKRQQLKSEYDYLLSELEENILTDMGNKIHSLMTKTDLMKGKLPPLGVHAHTSVDERHLIFLNYDLNLHKCLQ